MAGIGVQDLQNAWSSKFSQETRNNRHSLPRLVGNPLVSYDSLRMLCKIEGLGERLIPSTIEAHEIFMTNYPKMFRKPRKLATSAITDKREDDVRKEYKNPMIAKEIVIPHDKGLFPHLCKGFDEYLCSHSISFHMSKLHKHNFVITSPTSIFNARIKAIHKILRKLPFERKWKENDALFKHLISLPDISGYVESHVLKELCAVAQLDRWNDEGCTVFGNTGLHMVLRGSVVPQTQPCLSPVSSPTREFRSPTPIFEDQELKYQEKIGVGNCFGTLSKVEGREPNSRILSVITLEPCEFLKISTNDYEKVIHTIESREEEQKLTLTQTCKLFHSWPRLSLKKVSGLIKWRKFPPGQVLVKEGERCEIIGFIKKGVCSLKRIITVAHTFPDGKKEKRTKQVIIGRLGPGDSFGETTVIKNCVMPCAVMSETVVLMGTISTLDVYDLDDVTKSLLAQSYSEMETNMSEDEIEKEYIEQEKVKEWRDFKHKVVSDVLYFRAIQPGCSKWSRNPTASKKEQL